jgi:hypothetical protein
MDMEIFWDLNDAGSSAAPSPPSSLWRSRINCKRRRSILGRILRGLVFTPRLTVVLVTAHEKVGEQFEDPKAGCVPKP